METFIAGSTGRTGFRPIHQFGPGGDHPIARGDVAAVLADAVNRSGWTCEAVPMQPVGRVQATPDP